MQDSLFGYLIFSKEYDEKATDWKKNIYYTNDINEAIKVRDKLYGESGLIRSISKTKIKGCLEESIKSVTPKKEHTHYHILHINYKPVSISANKAEAILLREELGLTGLAEIKTTKKEALQRFLKSRKMEQQCLNNQ